MYILSPDDAFQLHTIVAAQKPDANSEYNIIFLYSCEIVNLVRLESKHILYFAATYVCVDVLYK